MSEAPRGRDQFAKYKQVFGVLVSLYKVLPLKMRKKALEKHRNTRGKFGMGLRYVILKSITDTIGDNVAIFPGVYIYNPEHLKIGSNVSIQPMSYLECGYGENGIVIGDDVSIAHGATILGSTHNHNDINIPIRDQGVISDPVTIKDNVWIGAKAIVLNGVTIEEGCIIGAGSVVTKSTVKNGIYVGAPAKMIKQRV